ncbi:hypothetical protein DMENIID0001_125510 [Sergentomyia squamirostris]
MGQPFSKRYLYEDDEDDHRKVDVLTSVTHLNEINGRDGMYQHNCPRCQKMYTYKKNLQRHLKFECGVEPTEHCHLCPYVTRYRHSLKSHMHTKPIITFGEVLSGCLLENENIVVTQKNDKFVLLEINTPSTEKRKDDGGKEGKRAVITDISDAKKVLQEHQQKVVAKPAAVTTNTTSVVTTVVTVPPKVTTKNHPRIKYSMKQPVPVSLHKSLNKFELLNFSLSRKFGNKVTGETTTVLSGTGAGVVTSTGGGYGNTGVGGGSTLSVIETEIAKVPASIIIQAPNSNKSASNINEDLQSSIMGDLSNYEIDDIELPDGTQIGFSDSTDSMDRDASRADYESRSADDNTKFAYIEGRSLQNYDFSQSDSNDDVNRQYVCRHCGKKYRWKSTLRRHENVECGGKEPMHQCPHCAYRAKQRGNLGVHIRKHHSEMPQLETRRKHRSS